MFMFPVTRHQSLKPPTSTFFSTYGKKIISDFQEKLDQKFPKAQNFLPLKCFVAFRKKENMVLKKKVDANLPKIFRACCGNHKLVSLFTGFTFFLIKSISITMF